MIRIIGFLVVLLPVTMLGQITITGTVIDAETSETLIGVNVSAIGTQTGTITDIDGTYSIEVDNAESVLSFSYVGYESTEVIVGSQKVINQSLGLNTNQLKEVVIVGYGTQKKSDVTGAISVISSEDLKEANATSVAKALQGRTSGVSISSTSGAPGSAPSIRIRGVGSINSSAQPIVVIDGIIAGIGALNDLNPKDIESISVLKDAASAAIYGARSSNGVILVKTKTGGKGKMKVNVSSQATFATLPRQMDIMNADQYRAFYKSAYDEHNRLYGATDSRVLPEAYTNATWDNNGKINSDWQDLITNEFALKHNNYFSISGGNEKSTYLFSTNHIGEDGVLLNTNAKLTNIRINSEHKLGSRVKVGENIYFTKKDGRTSADQWLNAVIGSPLLPVYNKAAKGGFQGPDPIFTGINERTNPVAELELHDNTYDQNSLNGNAFLELDILKGLKFRTVYGFGFFNNRNTSWTPKYELAQRSNPVASLREYSGYSKKWQFDQILTYNITLSNHNIGFMAGHTAENLTGTGVSAFASDFKWESLQTVSNGNPEFNSSSQFKFDRTSESYFGRINYDYAGKYLFTGSIRRDGSSQFGPNNRHGVFPSFSVGWKINDDFFQDTEWMDLLKFRFGYGINGNTPGGDYLYETGVSTAAENVYTLGDGDNAVFGAAPLYNFGSPSIRWESAEIINYGLDFTGFNGRVELYAEYFIKNQNNLITNLPLQYIYGLSGDANPPKVNLGDIKNSGFELNLSYKNFEGAFKYEVSANVATVKNVVDFIPSSRIFNKSSTNIAQIGNSIGSYYGYVAERLLQDSDFQKDENGNLVQDASGRYTLNGAFQNDFTAPGDIKFTDLNNDGIVNASDQTVIGKIIPDMTFGFNVGLQYKWMDLNLLMQGVNNVDLYNFFRSRSALASGNATSKDENKLISVQDYWTPDNTDGTMPRIGLGDLNDNARISTWWIEDASFLRLRNLQIGVTIPNKVTEKIGMRDLRMYIGGENLLTLTNYSGYDPEISSTSPFGTADYGNYPVPRFYQVGLTASF